MDWKAAYEGMESLTNDLEVAANTWFNNHQLRVVNGKLPFPVRCEELLNSMARLSPIREGLMITFETQGLDLRLPLFFRCETHASSNETSVSYCLSAFHADFDAKLRHPETGEPVDYLRTEGAQFHNPDDPLRPFQTPNIAEYLNRFMIDHIRRSLLLRVGNRLATSLMDLYRVSKDL